MRLFIPSEWKGNPKSIHQATRHPASRSPTFSASLFFGFFVSISPFVLMLFAFCLLRGQCVTSSSKGIASWSSISPFNSAMVVAWAPLGSLWKMLERFHICRVLYLEAFWTQRGKFSSQQFILLKSCNTTSQKKHRQTFLQQLLELDQMSLYNSLCSPEPLNEFEELQTLLNRPIT